MNIRLTTQIFLSLTLLCALSHSLSAADLPDEMKKASIEEKLGAPIDIHLLSFRDEEGQTVKLDKYFNAGKPVLLNLVYFGCPNLCTYLLNGTANSLRTLAWTVGKEFEMVTVSIDPTEKPELAKAKKASYLKLYGRLDSAAGWHFLTGDEDQIKKLADQMGFHYFYDKDQKQYAHSAALFVLTPSGEISRILYGIDFPNKDLKLSLLEASNGKIGNIFDRFLMFCYHYDPLAKGYSLYAMRLMKMSSALTLLIVALTILALLFRERKEKRELKERPL